MDWLFIILIVFKVISTLDRVFVKMIPILHGEPLHILLLLAFIGNLDKLLALELIDQKLPGQIASILVRIISVQNQELR